MLFRQITPPSHSFVTLAEAKAHLRIFHTDEDAYVQGLVDAAISTIDGVDGWLNRCILSQKWEITLDSFPADRGALHLPLPPIISVDDIRYDDRSYAEQTLVGHRVVGLGSTSGAYIVVPASTRSWPSTAYDQPGSLRVTFTAGYVVIPPSIKHAVLLMVSHYYEHREAAVDTGAKFGLLELPFGVQSLLFPHRYWC